MVKPGQKAIQRMARGSDPELLRGEPLVSSKTEGILAPGEVLDFSSGKPQKEFQMAEFLNLRRQEWRPQREDAQIIQTEYNQKRQELQALNASRPTEETEQALAQNEKDPGVYDVSFLHNIITTLRGASLQDAGTWLRAFVGRGNKRNPWKKYQENEGTLLHPESYVSRQTA